MSFEWFDLADPWRLRRFFLPKSDSLIPGPLPLTAAVLDGSYWAPALVAAAFAAGGAWFFVTHAKPRRARARRKRLAR